MKYYKLMATYRVLGFSINFITRLDDSKIIDELGDPLTAVFDVTEITEEEYDICAMSGEYRVLPASQENT